MSHDPQSPTDAADLHDDFDFDDGLDEDGNIPFECPRYWISGSKEKKGYWHCPLAGTEECDWECKE